MGVISRKLFPACESMCVCCPALRSRSRQPVKRYKKLLAEIFPKSPDGVPNERKIIKLCEYASKNPLRIPKIAKYLEERCYKELRNDHIKLVTVVADAYSKLLCNCKEQIAYFAVNLFNTVTELLDESKKEEAQIIGCQILTSFIYSQVDGTYAHNIENVVEKVCMLARKAGDEHQKHRLRASSLQCLSAIVWFMTQFAHIFVDFEKIVHATLDNYELEAQNEDDERREANHNWVDEVARCEGRGGELSTGDVMLRLRPEKKDPLLLTREEIETPKVWAQICIQRMVDLAKETTTMRRVLDPMFVYFDMGDHWVPHHGLGPVVLSDMLSFVENPGNQQLILSGVVRHLDHKNVAHDPHIKCHIIQTASCLARQVRSESVISDMGFVSDLFRHLRKTFQATAESVGEEELNVNATLQTSIEDCLLETVRGIVDVRPLFDMMANTLEKLSPVRVVARATLASLIIISHVISLASVSSHSHQVFPDTLLVQLLKVMLHSDVEIRVVGHQIFCVLLIPSFAHARNEVFNHQSKLHSKNASTFSSITALLEKLRGEIYGTNVNHGNEKDDVKQHNKVGEDWRHVWSHKNSPNMHIISSINGPASLTEANQYFLLCNEDQIAQLLSALWIQVNLPDNLPSNIEAIAHTFCLALSSSHLKNSNNNLAIRFFQFALSLRKMSLGFTTGSLPPAYQRSLLVLSTAMLMFAAKIYHISDWPDLLKLLLNCQVDPYVGISEDFQVYVKLQADMNSYGSASDNREASSILIELRDKAYESDNTVLDILANSLSEITKIEVDEVARQLSELFVPDEAFMFDHQSMLNVDYMQRAAYCNGSPSFDGDFSANSMLEDDIMSISSVNDVSRFIPKVPPSASPSMSHIASIGQLLESALEVAGQVAGASVSTSPLPYSTMTNQCEALGNETRKKLSNWLAYENDHSTKTSQLLLPSANGALTTNKVTSNEPVVDVVPAADNPWLALRLPPASPFDNFLRAARG